MKLSEYAKKIGLQYKTVWNMYQRGDIPNAYQLPSGTIIVEESSNPIKKERIVVYARFLLRNKRRILKPKLIESINSVLQMAG
jgi:predicted site-specific integrase-resolvase